MTIINNRVQARTRPFKRFLFPLYNYTPSFCSPFFVVFRIVSKETPESCGEAANRRENATFGGYMLRLLPVLRFCSFGFCQKMAKIGPFMFSRKMRIAVE